MNLSRTLHRFRPQRGAHGTRVDPSNIARRTLDSLDIDSPDVDSVDVDPAGTEPAHTGHAPRRHRRHSRRLGAVLMLVSATLGPAAAHAAVGYAQYGEPKYRDGFTHFDYVQPDAPKGGTLTLGNTATNSSFDKLNPFNLKGRPAPGLLELVFETLATYSLDETNSQYGLLADDIVIADDFRSATFHLHPQARFSNGDRITASDVQYSFDTLTGKKASPRFRSFFAEIARVVVVDESTVRFEYKRRGRDLAFVAGSLPVFSPRWGLQADGSLKPFDELRLETPIGSGPYRIERLDNERGITYVRNPRYWGSTIPVRRGTYNFDRVVYKLYKDQEAQIAALRAGEFDVLSMPQSRVWCCAFIGKRFDSGELARHIFPNRNPTAMNGWAFNLRRPAFQDKRVREAIGLILDFDWINQRVLRNDFTRMDSYFPGTPLQARGLPSAEEVALLEPWRDRLDPAVFGPMVELPTTRPPHSLRQNWERALQLFAEAGWTVQDGELRNARGEPFTLEVAGTRSPSPHTEPFNLNLAKAGIHLRRVVYDAATQKKRLNDFDFDFQMVTWREGRLPGAELLRNFDSKTADKKGSENVIGLKDPVVDALIRKLLDAETQQELEITGRALDRVLMHGHYIIPFRYINEHHLVAHRDLAWPERLPDYYGPYEWVLATWWHRPR